MFLDENNNDLDLNLNLTGGNMVKVLKGLVLTAVDMKLLELVIYM